MPNTFLISPSASPLQIVEVNATISAIYHTPQFGKDWFRNSIRDWQVKRNTAGAALDYAQKWQLNDAIRPQIAVPVGRLVTAYLINCANSSVATVTYALSQAVEGDLYNGQQLERFQYNFTGQGLGLAAGRYWFVVSVSNEPLDDAATFKLFVSEPLQFRVSWPQTLRMEYSNARNDYDMRFDMIRRFILRVDGLISDPTFIFEDSDFNDQQQNGQKLYSGKYNEYEVLFGAKTNKQNSLPRWIFDKITSALRCNYLTLDGKAFYRTANATIDITPATPSYPLANGVITLHGFEEDRNTVHGGGILTYQFPFAPFAISTLFLTGGGQPVYIAQNTVIEDQAGLIALIAAATANLDVDGTFSLDPDLFILTYTLGASETFTGFTDLVFSTIINFELIRTSGNNVFSFDYRGGVALVAWGDGLVERIGLGDPSVIKTYQRTFLTTTNKSFRIFYANEISHITLIRVATGANGFKVVAFDGSIPYDLIAWVLYRQNIGSIDGSFFSSVGLKSPNLRDLTLASNNTATVDPLITFTGSANLLNLNFSGNALDVSTVNSLLNDFYTSGFVFGSSIPSGGTYMIKQIPPATPTGVGATAKAGLISLGWNVDTD